MVRRRCLLHTESMSDFKQPLIPTLTTYGDLNSQSWFSTVGGVYRGNRNQVTFFNITTAYLSTPQEIGSVTLSPTKIYSRPPSSNPSISNQPKFEVTSASPSTAEPSVVPSSEPTVPTIQPSLRPTFKPAFQDINSADIGSQIDSSSTIRVFTVAIFTVSAILVVIIIAVCLYNRKRTRPQNLIIGDAFDDVRDSFHYSTIFRDSLHKFPTRRRSATTRLEDDKSSFSTYENSPMTISDKSPVNHFFSGTATAKVLSKVSQTRNKIITSLKSTNFSKT